MEQSSRDTQSISQLERRFQKFEADYIRKVQFQPAEAWEENERGELAKVKRLEKAKYDFWFFDKTYFPPKSHRQGYAKPGLLHRKIFEVSSVPGIHWILAHRDLAKTAYAIKIILWKLLTGQINVLGVYSETLTKARLINTVFEFLLIDNPRIQEDFETEIIKSNNDFVSWSCSTNPRMCIMLPFSEEKSLRGNNVSLDRPDYMLFDDLETLASSFKPDIVKKRISRLVEAYKSLRSDGVALGLGNNLHPSCAANKLLKEQRKGNKREYITVYPFPDWSIKKTADVHYKGSIWKEMYPAKSEAEMRRMRRIVDDKEWSEAQCDPKLESGDIFPKDFYFEYDPKQLPSDARGPAWCDQNLSLKGKGDTTVFGALLYSRSENKFYAYKLNCRSYSDPNKLLSDYFSIFDHRITIFGMDGNVSQESTWTANIRNWSVMNRRPMPPVLFGKYSADAQSALAQLIYKQSLVFFPSGYMTTDEGEQFFEQFHGFEGKKANRADDAADWFICCYSLGLQMGYFMPSSGSIGSDYEVIKVKSYGGF